MTTATTTPRWEQKRTGESRLVEDLLRQHFQQADAYRYNSASIRLRVIDPRFDHLAREARDAMVEKYIDELPPHIQRDIVALFTFAPSELQQSANSFRAYMSNVEFEDPTPSML